MLEWRFEPAGGGLRLVWAFWGCGGVAGCGGCVVVLVLKPRARRRGARGPSVAQRTFASCLLRQANFRWRTARIDPGKLGDAKDDNDAETLQRFGCCPIRLEAGPICRRLAKQPTSVRFWLKLTRVPRHVRGLSAPRVGPDQAQAVLSSERRSLAAPSGAPCARSLKPPSDRGKAASPLQVPSMGPLALARRYRRFSTATQRLGAVFVQQFQRTARESSDVSRAYRRRWPRLAHCDASGFLPRLLVNEQPPARARATLLHYALSAGASGYCTLL